MKFIRNSRIRERMVDIATKTLLLAISVLACLWMISGAKAATAEITSIHQSAAGEGEYAIDFAFSSPVAKEDVAVEFQRNFIQISLKGVSAYPARTEKLTHPLLEKVFTYQYQPDLARARVLLNVQASTIEKTSNWEMTSQGLRILVKGSAALVKAPVAKAKESKDSVKSKSSAAKAAPVSEDPEDAKVVQQIVEESKKPVSASAGKEAKEVKKIDAALAPLANTEEQPIFATQMNAAVDKEAKSKTSPVSRMIASLLLVVGIIGAGAIGYRRFVLGRGMPFQRNQNRMIETITTQALGPKRAVSVIRVLDQYMVIGMSGDNMNLLANLGTSINLDKYTDDYGIPTSAGHSSGTGASFADAFQGAISGISPSSPKGETRSSQKSEARSEAAPKADFRSMIKKRIEGFKPL
ncbi:MAG: FliO/MopB family protein [Bdellovibrionota bacterium]